MQVFQSDAFTKLPGIQHGTATQRSQPLTFGGHRQQEVAQARAAFAKRLGITLNNCVFGRQVHGRRVRIVEDVHRGAGARQPTTYLAGTDGLLTQRPDVALGVFTADCVPVLLADPVTGWIGALHVGWKGAVAGIVAEATRLLTKHGVHPATVRVWLGPAICGSCYQVPPRRLTQLRRAFHGYGIRGTHVDLRAGIRRQLQDLGYAHRHIDVSPVCTAEDASLPSHRRDGVGHANTLTLIQRATVPGDPRGLRIAILGFGTQGGGESALRFAVRAHAQHVIVVDEQPARAFTPARRRNTSPRVTWVFGALARRFHHPVDWVLKNPAVPPSHPVLRALTRTGAQSVTDIGVFRSRTPNPIIAVTGTKGKTTVATWLAHVLRARWPRVQLAGNVRRSPLELPSLRADTPVILELSSFQLEALELPLRARVAVITNLYPDHLNRHGTMRSYALVKARIVSGQSQTDDCVLPLDSAWQSFGKVRTRANISYASALPHKQSNAFIEDGWIVLQGRRLVRTSALRRYDTASARNAVTVALAAHRLGVPRRTIAQRLQSFRGVAERYEVVRVYRGRTFINDTTATNPVAAASGVMSVRGPFILIAGGTDKHLDVTVLVRAAKRARSIIFLPGSATEKMQRALQVRIPIAKSMSEAVQRAWRASAPGDTILLSPGAASFGLFRNEFDRGAQFVAAVRKL